MNNFEYINVQGKHPWLRKQDKLPLYNNNKHIKEIHINVGSLNTKNQTWHRRILRAIILAVANLRHCFRLGPIFLLH